jgi:hypothetical protein
MSWLARVSVRNPAIGMKTPMKISRPNNRIATGLRAGVDEGSSIQSYCIAMPRETHQ